MEEGLNSQEFHRRAGRPRIANLRPSLTSYVANAVSEPVIYMSMKTERQFTVWLFGAALGAALSCGAAFAIAPQSTVGSTSDSVAKQDVKKAGDETKKATKDAAHSTKKGTEKAYDKTRNGTEKAYDKTKDATKDAAHSTAKGTEKAYDKTKDATKDAAHATANGTKKAFDKTKSVTKGAVDGAKDGAKKPE